MTKKLTAFLLLVCLVGLFPTRATAIGDETERRIAAATKAGTASFDLTHDVEDLRRAAITLSETIDQRATRTGNVTEHRRAALGAFATLLRRIDALLDPAFDPAALPVVREMTPAQTRRYNEQRRVAAAASDTLSLIEIALHRFHDRVPGDPAALDDIVRGAGLSEARRAAIHAMY